MPALPDVPKTLRIALRMSLNEDTDLINRFFIEYLGTAPTSPQLDTYAASVSTAWGAHLKALMTSNGALEEVHIIDLSSSTAAIGDDGSHIAGTRAGLQLSAAACVVLKLQIARRYRGGHPRLYLPFGSAPDLSDAQRWGSTFLGNVVTGWTSFLTDITAAGWTSAGTLQPINVSYFQGFTNVTYPSGRTKPVPTRRITPVKDLVLSHTTNPKVASQRRRNQQSS